MEKNYLNDDSPHESAPLFCTGTTAVGLGMKTSFPVPVTEPNVDMVNACGHCK